MRVRHLADENRENSFSVDRLRLYTGSPESAREAALRDLDQYEVKAILAWKGDPNKRSEMKFWVVARLTLQSVPRFMVVLLGLRCSGVGTTLQCLR